MRPSTPTASSASERSSSSFARRSTTRRSRGSASSDLEHDVLHDRVVIDRVLALVLAVARFLEAAVRHLRHEREVVVDPDGPEVDVVGPGDGLLLVAEVLDADVRAEDLVLDDLAALVRPGGDGRLEVGAR